MTDLALSFGGCDYWDRSHSLIDGTIKPTGIDLTYLVTPLQDLFRRMVQHEEFDAAEMSMSTYIALVANGDRRFVGVPVFPSRNFRHSYLFVNAKAGINSPGDLRGRRIGVPEYQMTAALWIRSILQHDFGVHPRDMLWSTGGLRAPGYVERAHMDLPDDVRLRVIGPAETLEGLLDTGEIDALISPVRPRSLVARAGLVRRMFPDYREVEKDYFRRTDIFPIMHTVVMRRPVYEANRWAPASLFEAFELAKHRGRKRLLVTGPLAVALPWVPADLEEIDEVFGGRDPWAYGIDANRHVLNAMVEMSVEQGLAKAPVSLEDLFVPECFVSPAVGEAA